MRLESGEPCTRHSQIAVCGGHGSFPDLSRSTIVALPTVYPGIPLQRCWTHEISNILDKVRKPDRDAVKTGLRAIMNAPDWPKTLSAARRFADAWEETYPKALACPRNDLFSYVDLEARVPQDHPLRPIRALVDEALLVLSPDFERLYSKTGRPSIAPEKLLRALLLRIHPA